METQPSADAAPENLKGPKLQGIYKTLELLRKHTDSLGTESDWRTLHERVKPFRNASELSDNVNEAVREYVLQRLPSLKEKLPTIEALPDAALCAALADNFFEELEDDIKGKRKEIVLAIAAHVVKSIETRCVKELLSKADEETLTNLGLDKDLAALTCDLLTASQKADPLFIRFLAYTRLSKTPPEEATPTGLLHPERGTIETIASLFPHETQYIGKRLEEVSQKEGSWSAHPGAPVFRNYLQELARFHTEQDPNRAMEIQMHAQELFKELAVSNFPVLITFGIEGYYKEPYFDPELRVSISAPEAREREKDFTRTRNVMADTLGTIGVSQFADEMKSRPIKNLVALGSYGTNLTFNASAQEIPITLIYENVQARQYDRNLPQKIAIIEGVDALFAGLSDQEKQHRIEEMSSFDNAMHEIGHSVYLDGTPEAQRFGSVPITAIDEVKAESIYRGMLPEILEANALPGTKEQWAAVSTALSLYVLQTHPADNAYFKAAVHTLNEAIAQGSITFTGEKVRINDFEAYHRIQKECTKGVITAYEDKTMNETKAAAWVKKECTPSDELQRIIGYLKKSTETS